MTDLIIDPTMPPKRKRVGGSTGVKTKRSKVCKYTLIIFM